MNDRIERAIYVLKIDQTHKSQIGKNNNKFW